MQDTTGNEEVHEECCSWELKRAEYFNSKGIDYYNSSHSGGSSARLMKKRLRTTERMTKMWKMHLQENRPVAKERAQGTGLTARRFAVMITFTITFEIHFDNICACLHAD